MPNTRLTKRVFNFIVNHRSTKWLNTLYEMFIDIGIEDYLQEMSPVNIAYCRNKLMELYNEE